MRELDEPTARWLLASGRFDAAYYQASNPDVAKSGLAPWAHFCRYGWWLGRSPSAGVAGLVVRNIAPGVVPCFAQWLDDDPGYNEFCRLWHSPLLDPLWYVERYPDVAAANIEPTTHYWCHGGREGRHPGPWFDTSHYLALLHLSQLPDTLLNDLTPAYS